MVEHQKNGISKLNNSDTLSALECVESYYKKEFVPLVVEKVLLIRLCALPRQSPIARKPLFPAATATVNIARQSACWWRFPVPQRVSIKSEKASTIASWVITQNNLKEYSFSLSPFSQEWNSPALACRANTLSKWIDCQLLSSTRNQLSSNGGGHFTPLVCYFGVKLKVVIGL